MHPTSDKRALAVLIFGACMIGFGPVLVRLAQAEHVDPAGSGFWRVTLALPILAAMSFAPRRGPEIGRGPSWIAVLAGFLFAGDLLCWHYGIRFTSVANATVLSNMTPILVTAAAWLMFREAPRPVFLVGMALAIGGSAMMGLAKGGGGLAPHLGDGLSAFTAVWYAAYILVVREARQSMGASVLIFWSSLVASPLLLASALFLGERIWPTGPLGWAALVGLGVMHVAGQGSIAWALGRLPAPLAAVVVLVQPVVAALAAWAAFGERLTWMQALGGAIALGGVVLAQAAGRAAARREAAAVAIAGGDAS
jgi:drug/metabolite transporter (DMT)-like permease